MVEEKDKVDQAIEKLDQVLKAVAQGRLFRVGTKVLYNGKLGVITYLNKGPQDPEGSTVDFRLEDGTVIEGTPVSSPALKFFRQ